MTEARAESLKGLLKDVGKLNKEIETLLKSLAMLMREGGSQETLKDIQELVDRKRQRIDFIMKYIGKCLDEDQEEDEGESHV